MNYNSIVFTISLTMGKSGKREKKQEIIKHYKAKKFNLWTSLEHVFTLTVSTRAFYRLFQKRGSKRRDGWAERCKISKSEQSLTAALPEEQKQKSHLYL